MSKTSALALIFLCLAGAPAFADTDAVVTGGPFEVKTVKDVTYCEGKDEDKAKHKLDLYLPKDQKDFPVLFFVHGGAWVFGDRWMYGTVGKTFAKNGVGFVAISYRLSPGVQHPAHAEDVAAAFAWTHKNIAGHGGRADRIFVCGHSAGGHLCSLLTLDERYLKAHKLSAKDIRGAAPLSGVYTISETGQMFEKVFGTDAEVRKQASPLTHVGGKHPPFLIGYAEKDYPSLDVGAERLGKKLKECGCEMELVRVKDRDHVTLMSSMAKDTDPMTQAVLRFIAKHSELKLSERK
jgi:acetyl esterase/lipase